MIKKLPTVMLGVFLSLILISETLYAQTEVMIRDLHTYDFELTSQEQLPEHPLNNADSLVIFDAIVVSNPKSSGLASITSAGVPGRIHVFVTDVNAIAEGADGMSLQIVVSGAERTTLEGLGRGDVIRVTGNLAFFGNNSQFNSTDVELLGNVTDTDYENLAPLLEPTKVEASELNIAAEEEGLFKWNAANYTKYIHRYVKVEGAEVIDRLEANTGRPWLVARTADGILTSNDTSLRYRNDRQNYAYDPDSDEGLNYNYRRIENDGADGPYVPPPNGAVVEWSGFVLVNTFNPGGYQLSNDQATLKLAYYEDGAVWIADGDDAANRLTPENWPNDLKVLGFPATLTDLTISPDGDISGGQEVTVNVDVLLPEDNYTLNEVRLIVTSTSYQSDDAVVDTLTMTVGSGNTYSVSLGDFVTFTTVDFTVEALATTPDGIQTTGRASDSFSTVDDSQTAPVTFSPSSGTFSNFIEVSMSSATADATIYYTLDGSTPTNESQEYTEPVLLQSTTTITAIAMKDGLSDSPVNSRDYEIEDTAVEVATLAELREGARDGTHYRYTGNAVVVYARAARNQKYLMDSTAGILIDDSPGTVQDGYHIGSVMTGVLGTLGAFNEVIQYVPAINPGTPADSVEVVPVDVALGDITVAQHESMLVKITDVTFVESGDFAGGTNYHVYDANGDTLIFRTNFTEVDYIGQPIPTGSIDMTAIVGNFRGTLQLIARSSEDLGMATSIDENINVPMNFVLDQNYPNPFNPTTTIRYSLAEATDVRITVYDILGRRVSVLVNETLPAGRYSVNFDANRLASGTYIYRLETSDFVSTKKMMLIK